MPDWTGKLVEIFFNKVAPLPLFAVAGSSAILLFGPDRFLKKVSLISFRDANTRWIGLAFLVSSVYLIGYAINWLAQHANRRFSVNRIKRRMDKRLRTLNGVERDILREFLIGDTRTLQLRSDHPAVLSLEAARFIYKAGQIVAAEFPHNEVGPVFQFKYHLNEYVYEQLQAHPELVEPDDAA